MTLSVVTMDQWPPEWRAILCKLLSLHDLDIDSVSSYAGPISDVTAEPSETIAPVRNNARACLELWNVEPARNWAWEEWAFLEIEARVWESRSDVYTRQLTAEWSGRLVITTNISLAAALLVGIALDRSVVASWLVSAWLVWVVVSAVVERAVALRHRRHMDATAAPFRAAANSAKQHVPPIPRIRSP